MSEHEDFALTPPPDEPSPSWQGWDRPPRVPPGGGHGVTRRERDMIREICEALGDEYARRQEGTT